KGVDEYLRNEQLLINQIRSEIGQSEQPVQDIRRLIEERKELEKEVERLRHQQSASKLDDLLSDATEFNGIKLIVGEIAGADMDLLKQLGYESLEKSKKGTITVLGARDDEAGKVYIAAAVTDDVIKEKGIKAGTLVGELGKMLGGGGGGQPNLATAGGRNPEKLPEVLGQIESIVKKYLEE
ncbi:MAG TPA: DHHA1 domain-containing protein, partial [Balneolaceae bacterium]|nr:DHHA1 domain-containing protein [Balneolaceae bacterium]